MQLRKATEKDFKDCYEMAKQYDSTTDYDRFVHTFNQYLSLCHFWVAEIDNKVVGAIIYMFSRDHFNNTPIVQKLAWYVDKEHSNKRIGYGLLKFMEHHAEKENIKEVHVWVPNGVKMTGYEAVETLYKKNL